MSFFTYTSFGSIRRTVTRLAYTADAPAGPDGWEVSGHQNSETRFGGFRRFCDPSFIAPAGWSAGSRWASVWTPGWWRCNHWQ